MYAKLSSGTIFRSSLEMVPDESLEGLIALGDPPELAGGGGGVQVDAVFDCRRPHLHVVIVHTPLSQRRQGKSLFVGECLLSFLSLPPLAT